MTKYYPPKYQDEQFHCIHCGVFSAQKWETFTINGYYHNILTYCVCQHCGEMSYWYDTKMIIPSEAPVPPAHQDMPEECLTEYNEARDVVARSPRAAAALLRLAVQNLINVLGKKGKINTAIGELVEEGLPVKVQQALDICRVIGNNAVHPGEINLNDSPEIAHNLFNMINFIVDDRIARPKQIEELFNQLPEGAKEAVAKRDKKTKPNE